MWDLDVASNLASGPFCEPLEGASGRLGSVLGVFRRVLAPSWPRLGPSWESSGSGAS